jgi:NADH-quinone oxidoreductase subunit N
MSGLLLGAVKAPHIDYMGLSPLFAVLGGAVVVLMAGLFPGRAVQRVLVPLLTVAALGAAIGLSIANWDPGDTKPIVEGALSIDSLALFMSLLFYVTGIAAVLLSLRDHAVRESGAGEYFCLLLGSIAGMVILAGAENLMTLFVGLELLSIPLYVLCASEVRRAASLEAGLKYLVIGSVGSATLLYGLALIYGATGATDFDVIAKAIGNTVGVGDPLLLTGIALGLVGLAFKASVAPFHQWTPDAYQGAPTPVTAFMAVATKAAAFAVFIRFFLVALGPAADNWQPALAVLAAISIVVGNIGALGQDSLKRLLGYSGVAQAGYMMVGLVAASTTGVNALIFYLAAYALMNLAAFAVIVIRERETQFGDDIRSVQGLGRQRPELAWPLTISMLALAGLPGTVGFIGKLYLIEGAVGSSYTWLGVAIAIGTMISLAYYLRVVAAVWMRPAAAAVPGETPDTREVPAMAGGSPEADAELDAPTGAHCLVIIGLATLAAGLTVFFGIIPSPLVDWAQHAGAAISGFVPG